MKFALLAHGSRGDIQPMVAVADALRRRGHDIRLTVNVNSVDWVRRSGLEVIPLRFDAESFLRSPAGQQALANGKTATFFRALADEERAHNQDMIDACREAATGVDMLLSTVMTACRAMAVGDALDLPHVMLSTMPMYTTGAFAAHLSPVRDLRVGLANRLTWAAYFALYWAGQRDLFNAARADAGLPAWTRRPRFERERAVHMYSKHVVQLPGDACAGHRQSGFATLSPTLRAQLGEADLPDGLGAWLSDGPPPVFFGFGSMPVLQPRALLAVVHRLCRKHDIRALIGAGWSQYESDGGRGTDVFIAPAFDHDRVLPRCRAAVHHGGAGTTHASLRAGCPTLVCSIFADQPFWGTRVETLGVGATFPFQKLSEERLSRGLAMVLRAEVARRAEELGALLTGEDGVASTVAALEQQASELGLSR